ncbi:MAG: HDIG domain-containing protein [Prevotella sp.]|nr:HDIG domain-containing protein [Prevotella sp.]
MDYQAIIDKYYGEGDSELKSLLLQHSQAVARRALHIADKHPELQLDCQFLYDAAMLHDIGIIECHAPGIHCDGWAPYICHGVIGSRMLHWHGVDNRYARVCARHTGAGLTQTDIVSQHLPLPVISLLPETNEEKVICYADKFYSKSHPEHEKTIEQAIHSLEKFGQDGVERFKTWVEMFE